MYAIIGSNIIFNIIEYFSFINIFLFALFTIISTFYVPGYSSTLYYTSLDCDNSTLELISTLFCLLFLIIIITPSLIILLDYDLVVLPSFIIYPLGLQWAWQSNLVFCPIDIGYNSYCDHYVITTISSIYNNDISYLSINYLSINKYINSYGIIGNNHSISKLLSVGKNTEWNWINSSLNSNINSSINSSYNNYSIISNNHSISKLLSVGKNTEWNWINKLPFYLWDINNYILIPLFSYIKLMLYSFDVIHILSFYSQGIKIDATPGRINLSTTLRLLWKGEYRGKCSESCGQGHLSMVMLSLTIILYYTILYLFIV